MAKQGKVVEIDIEALEKWIASTGSTKNALSRQLGYDGGFFRHIIERGRMTVPAYKLFCAEFGFEYGCFIKKEEVVKEEVIEEKPTYNMDEITKKLDELEVAINKLGNIQMQNMEYLKNISVGIKKQCDYMGLRK